jgi:hypothetical protein
LLLCFFSSAIIGAGVFIGTGAQILFKKGFSWGLGFALQTEVWIADIQENFTETNFFCFWHKTILNSMPKTFQVVGAKLTVALKTEQR